MGHDDKNCWDDPNNKDKVPTWYLKKKENRGTTGHGETGLFNGDIEVLLMASDKVMHFPETLDLLLEQDIWVADTGASCDSTGHAYGLTNKRIAPSDNGVTLTDGSKKRASMIADLDMM
eukprot:4409008-Ditylum_brightwellii.AAC.1